MSFGSLTKDINPKICRLCVCVLINKRSFEAFMCLDLQDRTSWQDVPEDRASGQGFTTGQNYRTELKTGLQNRTSEQDFMTELQNRTELQHKTSGQDFRTRLQNRTELQNRTSGQDFRTGLRWIFKKKKKTRYKKLFSHVESHASAVSLLESRE